MHAAHGKLLPSLLLIPTLLIGGGLVAMKLRPHSPLSARAVAETAPTSGQLTILDKKGRVTALCPLKHTDVTADVAGYVARVRVEQEFINPTTETIEAVYTFPLPSDAAVDDMTMILGSRTIRGQIMKREEAREVYENAKAQGKSTALLDQERPNIFTQSVANILPGEKIVIAISYVQTLKYDEGKYEFVFPMVVGPRFVPGGGATVPGQRGEPSPAPNPAEPGTQAVVTDADKITPPITPPGTRAGHDISLTVRLDAGLPIQDMRSTLHPIAIERVGQTRAIVRLKNENELPNKDFILQYTAAGSEVQSGLLTYAPGNAAPQPVPAAPENGTTAPKGGGYFTLIVQPPLAPPQTAIASKEMVFVIDQTGSQSGWPIKKAKETMSYCIKNLNPGDTFQLIGFNTQLYPCFLAPVPATPDTIAKALRFLAPIEGNGGTDILQSVDYALTLPDDLNRLRIVCYLTDGYVGNDMQILDYIAKNRGRARMFPFGMGNSVNRFLIEGMAKEGKGASDYVTLLDDGQAAVAKFYRRIASPLLLDISVDWNGLPVADVFPKQIPDVFTAQPIILKGRYTQATEGDITIHGRLRGQPWQQTIHVNFPASSPQNSAMATLWAREKIEDLQQQDWIGAQTVKPQPDIHDQIVATALEYRLMSQYTSFVAVEEKIINVGGTTRKLDVPVEMPEGVAYEGIFGRQAEKKQQSQARKAVPALSRTASSFGLSAPAPSKPVAPSGGAGGRGLGRGTAREQEVTKSKADVSDKPSAVLEGLADGKPEAVQSLAAKTPEERRALLEAAKLAPALREIREQVRKNGQKGETSLEVQVWLNGLPKGGLKILQELGFTVTVTLTPDRLLLGTIRLDKLDALMALEWVRRIEPPKYR